MNSTNQNLKKYPESVQNLSQISCTAVKYFSQDTKVNCSCVRTYMDPTVDWFYQIRLIRPKSLHFEKKEQDCFKNFS